MGFLAGRFYLSAEDIRTPDPLLAKPLFYLIPLETPSHLGFLIHSPAAGILGCDHSCHRSLRNRFECIVREWVNTLDINFA